MNSVNFIAVITVIVREIRGEGSGEAKESLVEDFLTHNRLNKRELWEITLIKRESGLKLIFCLVVHVNAYLTWYLILQIFGVL